MKKGETGVSVECLLNARRGRGNRGYSEAEKMNQGRVRIEKKRKEKSHHMPSMLWTADQFEVVQNVASSGVARFQVDFPHCVKRAGQLVGLAAKTDTS